MQKLCSEETGSEIENPRFTELRRSKENAQRVDWAEVR